MELELGAVCTAAEPTKAINRDITWDRIFYGATTKPNPDIASWEAEHSKMPNSGTRSERKNVSNGVTKGNQDNKSGTRGRKFLHTHTYRRKKIRGLNRKG